MPTILAQPADQIDRARRFRKEMSLPEVLLWQELRKRPGGFKFRRQVPQAPYSLDFACLSIRLAIEVDGSNHDSADGQSRDAHRDAIMAGRGFRTVRIAASDILADLDAVVRLIVMECERAETPPPSLRDGPPPRSGED